MRRFAARASALAALVAGVLGASGCDRTPSTTLAQAQAKYPPLLQAVAAQLTKDTGATWKTEYASGAVPTSPSGTCSYSTETLRTPEYFGSSVPWDRVRSSVDAVLAKEGFTIGDPPELKGGYTGLDATDKDGATLTIRAKTWSEMQITAHVAGPGC